MLRADWRAPAAALALGVAVAVGAVAALEAHHRAEERGDLVFVADPPGLKYAYAPGDVVRKRGWQVGRAPAPRVPGARRVVFVGDSVTFGVHVTPREPWPVVVSGWLDRQARALDGSRVEGINLGMTGYDIGQVAALTQREVARWEPDLVVYGSYANDVAPTRLLYRKAAPDPVYVSREVPVEVGVLGPRADGWLVSRSAVWRRLLGARMARWLTANQGATDDLSFYAQHLTEMASWSASSGVSLVVVALAPHVLAGAGCADLQPDQQGPCQANATRHRQTTDRIAAAGLPWVDTLPTLEASGQPHFFAEGKQDPDHPGRAGHRVYAEAALPLLQRALGLPVEPFDPDAMPKGPDRKKSSRDYPRPDRP